MKTAIISGGNGGLGKALAAQLQADYWHTVLLDIDVTGLAKSESQTPIKIDLTDTEKLDGEFAKIIASCDTVDLVIYNAGITHIGAFSGLEEKTHRRVFEINYFAAARMAKAFLIPIREAKGTHLAISSVAGFSPLFHRTAYAASKHALQGFFNSLRSEEAPFGVETLIAAPSFIATNIGNDQRQDNGISRPGSASDGVDYISPQTAAAVILRGLRAKQKFIPVGRIARLSWWINRLSPPLFQRLMERKIRKL